MKISLKNDREVKYLEHRVEYTVYTVYLTEPIEFMIMVHGLPSAPHAVCINDVEVIDNRLSRYWVFGQLVENNVGVNKPKVLSFPEWANDAFFYQNLLDGVLTTSTVWQDYRAAMELEFASTSLSIDAEPLANGWLQCGKCLDAWLALDTTNEVVICPACLVKQRNPCRATPNTKYDGCKPIGCKRKLK